MITAEDRAFAVWLRAERKKTKLSVEQIGKAIGFRATSSSSGLARIETCQRGVTIGEAWRVARLLDVPIPDLSAVCLRCGGNPPEGFSCQDCGAAS